VPLANSPRRRASPKQAVTFLKDRLPTVGAVDAKRVDTLIAHLENEKFAVREKAASELAKLGEQVKPLLQKAKEASPSPEVNRRINSILGAPYEPPTGDRLRVLRAIATLERIGTADSREVLKRLAAGDAAARETREAKEALARLR
jgi:HEAT repeat protein